MDLDLDMDMNSDLDEHADTSSDADTKVRGPYTLVYILWSFECEE